MIAFKAMLLVNVTLRCADLLFKTASVLDPNCPSRESVTARNLGARGCFIVGSTLYFVNDILHFDLSSTTTGKNKDGNFTKRSNDSLPTPGSGRISYGERG